MSEDFKCQADDTAKGDVVSADASSIERGAEAYSGTHGKMLRNRAMEHPESPLSKDLLIAAGWIDALNYQLQEAQRQLESLGDEDHGLVWPAPKTVRRGRVVWDDEQPAQRPTEEPQQSEGDERPLQAQHQPDIEKARAIAAATTDELRGITDKGPFHLAYYIPSPSKFVAAIATALRAEREAIAKFVENWPHVHPNVSSSIAKGIRTGDTHD